jgi:carbamoyl-phosphate synthase large subunit
VVDLVHENNVQLIINTPTNKQSRSDGYQIRRAAVDYKVPYITTIQAALAAADAIVAMKLEKITIKPIKEYHKENLSKQ